MDEAAEQLMAEVKGQVEGWNRSKVEPLREEVARLGVQVKGALDGQREARRASLVAGSESRGRTRVLSGPYEGLTPLDLSIVRSVLRGQEASPSGYNPATLEEWGARLKAAMDSTTATTGDELVNTQQARELWMDVNLEAPVLGLLSRVLMPTNPFEIPLQLGDVDWYPGTENAASKSTSLATKKQTLTAHELVSEVPWSYTLDEDAVISMMGEVRNTLVRNAAEVLDDVLLNADTSVTNGINSDGATIAATTAGKAHWLLGFDGLIHLPLVDNTAQRTDHNAAINDDLFNQLRLKLAKYAVRPRDCAFITDINTFIRTMSVANVRTLDKYGPSATILSGELANVEGVPLIVSEQMRLADADGKVTDAGNVVNTGRVLIVNRSQWRVGFRREMTIETVRDAQKRQNIMVVSFRVAFQERSGTRSTATHTALRFNITGVT